MKRPLLALAVLFLVAALPVRNAEADTVLSSVVVGCAFGAGTLGAATYFRLVPALASGILVTPFAEIVAVNALIGCGIGVVGVFAANIVAPAVVPSITK